MKAKFTVVFFFALFFSLSLRSQNYKIYDKISLESFNPSLKKKHIKHSFDAITLWLDSEPFFGKRTIAQNKISDSVSNFIITDEGDIDELLSGIKHRISLKKTEKSWMVTDVIKEWRCKGDTSFSSTLCDTDLSLLFVGDIMQHKPQITAAFRSDSLDYDFLDNFKYITPILSEADLSFGNLELTFGGKPYQGYPRFSSPDILADNLREVGFDVLFTANNHSCDRGEKGISNTINVLDSTGLLHTGTFLSKKDERPLIIRKKGIKLGVLNYTYGTNGLPIPENQVVNLIDTVSIEKGINKVKQQNCDQIIVCLHWGWEYKRSPNSEQVRLANFCFEKGADIVIGSHPHVIQKMELKKTKGKKRFVAYSLGNFISNQRDRYRDGGATALIKLKRESGNVKLDTVNYLLSWTWKEENVEKINYKILPGSLYGKMEDSLSTADRKKFKKFLNDSKKLLDKENIGVPEGHYFNAE